VIASASPALRVVAVVAGVAIIAVVLDAAIRTFLLPRVSTVRLTRLVAGPVGRLFRLVASESRTYETRDRVLALYPPVVLLSFQAVWLMLTWLGFSLLYLGAGVSSFADAARYSGSALFTLGSATPADAWPLALEYVEAAIGLTLLALLISFLPTIYAAFSRREMSVSRLAVRAGTPATPWGLLEVAHTAGSLDRLDELWLEWESWFIELSETHTSLLILNYYRSPSPYRSWVTASATVLDAAALRCAVVDVPLTPEPQLCIRSGWLALQALGDYFEIPYPAEPTSTDRIAVTRAQFDVVVRRLRRAGVPVVADLEQAWTDFVGWRVNYDVIIEVLHHKFTAPHVDWDTARDVADLDDWPTADEPVADD